MEEHFSELDLNAGIATVRKNLPVITLPQKTTISRSASTNANPWISGTILAVLALLLLLTLLFSARHAKDHLIEANVLAQLHIHHAQLPYTVEQALSGNAAAFARLQEQHYQLNQYALQLAQTQSESFGQDNVVPIADQPALDSYFQQWRTETQNLGLIQSHKDTLNDLAGHMRSAAGIHHQLIRRSEALISRMAERGNFSNQIKTIEAIKQQIEMTARNIQSIFPNDSAPSDITAQIARERAHISGILQILSQGSNGLGNASDKDEVIQDLLSHIYALMRKFDDHLNDIEKEITAAMTVQSVVHEVIDHSETMIDHIKELGHETEERAKLVAFLLDVLSCFLGASLIIAALFFAKSLRAFQLNSRKPEIVSPDVIGITQAAIRTLLVDMKKIADGDLRVRTDITHPMTGAIADAINCTIEELHTLVEQVNQSSTLVVTASDQAQQVSSELLAAAQHQTAKIEDTTLAVLGMTDSITEIADMATESANVAKQSLATAEKGTLAVRESIAGMNEIRTHIQDTSKRIKRLGESSQEIGEIVALITDITEQTNVLAVNTALQATAAGEAGRGFMVIAQEVQRLAERSAEASKQISELVLTIQGDTQDAMAAMERSTVGVTQGTTRSDAVSRALEEIETVSKQLAVLVTNIFDTTHIQTRSAHEVVANMEEILHITRQNTEGTRQTTTSIKQITGFASELRASVSNFNV
ncbi:methyl-accepting chemotaxis protein [Nitrosomonas sp. JL21]|uniref:methyl-accepting chemotaxis protein n=1 Tax=Nitrosomonas sp. JL21 TaxID=153949 RepID=UPI00136BF8CA|nr:methyl-accepting chemotaxis protein [Nitrosomonas sp. JL21]MBL8497129.1 methyl-accepting chemotaxis protein [Nitrosomonas sp.]MXS76599.1 methyl-accepting chemotaxis protein [Nitrosomonas sp. JL21]